MQTLTHIRNFCFTNLLKINSGGVQNGTTTYKNLWSRSNTNMLKYVTNFREDKKKGWSNEIELFTQLLTEAGLNKSTHHLDYRQKKLLLTTEIKVLKDSGLLDKNIDMERHLLGYFGLFPYIKFQNTLLNRCRQSPLTIKKLRDSIEKQYLAWKFNVHYNIVHTLYGCYNVSFMSGRSLSSFKSNLKELMDSEEIQNESITNKIYILTMNPFKMDHVKHFKGSFAGVPWDKLGKMYPEIIRKPYISLIRLLNILDEQNFSDTQIQNALPAFRNNFITILGRLNYILNSRKFHSLRNDISFLTLLCVRSKDLEKYTWKEIKNKRNDFLKSRECHTDRIQLCTLHYELYKELDVDIPTFTYLCRHPKVTSVSWSQIYDTITYLKKNFSDDEIRETLQIILYPRTAIERGLNKIKENEHLLREIGYNAGHISNSSDLFSHGTKLQNKTLQLCLYYIEKEQNFSGTGALL